MRQKQCTVLSFTRDPRPEYKVLERILAKRECTLKHVATTDYAYDEISGRGRAAEHLFHSFSDERQKIASDWALEHKHVPIEELYYNGYSLGDLLQYEESLLRILGDVQPLRWWYPFDFKSSDDARLKLRFYAVLLINVIENILRNEMPDKVVMWNGFPAIRRVISKVAEKFGIQTVYLERGFFSGTMQMDAEGVNVLSSLGKDTNAGKELSENQKAILNRFIEDYTLNEKSIVQQQESHSAEEWRTVLGINGTAKIVFLPLQVYHDTNLILFSKFSSNEKLLTALMEGVRKFDDILVVAKTHPESNADEKQRLERIMGDRGRIIEKGNVHSLIRLSDAVAVNNSTVGIEAMTYFKPIVAFGESVYSNKGIVFKIDSSPDVEPALKDALAFNGCISGVMKDRTEAFLFRTIYEYLSPQINAQDKDSEEGIYRKFFPVTTEYKPSNGTALNKRIQEAKVFVSEGEYHEAIKAFTGILNDFKEINELYPILCDLYIETGRYDIPEEWILNSIQYDSSFLQTFKDLCSELIVRNRFADSGKILTALAKVRQDYPAGRATEKEHNRRNWALDSGERQTADCLEKIRRDHINRYEYISNFINNRKQDKQEVRVLDMFCGNGYGSYLISGNISSAHIDAVDGSEDAIQFAMRNFSSQRIRYQHTIFPSPVELDDKYDYIVSVESIEHIEDDNSFLKFLFSKLKKDGILFLSFPNKHKLDLGINPNPYHVRHYTYSDIQSLIHRESTDIQIVESYGQDVYDMDAVGNIKGLIRENDMALSKNYEGQFLMVALEKVN